MITRVEIAGYKSLAEVALDLRPLSVIVGANASGKGNLFDALRLLGAMVTRSDLGAAFDSHRGIPIEAFFAEHGIARLLDEERLRFGMSVDVRLSEHAVAATERRIRDLRGGRPTRPDTKHVKERYLRYALVVEFLPRTGVLRVADERLEALREDGGTRPGRRPFIARNGPRLSLRTEGRARPIMTELGMPHTLVSQPLHPPHHPHVTAFREEVQRWRFHRLEPAVIREPAPLGTGEAIGCRGRDVAGHLYSVKVNNPRQFETLSKALRDIVPAVSGMDVERTPAGFVELSVREDDAAHSARVVSEGTLRVIGMLAALASDTAGTTIGFEHPEIGVHPRRMAIVARLFKNATRSPERQVLLTTHSPVLPDCFDPRDLLAARREGHRSDFQPIEPLPAPPSVRDGAGTTLGERLTRGDFGG